MNGEDPIAKARRVWDGFAPKYDRGMRVLERISSAAAGNGCVPGPPETSWKSVSVPA